MNVRCSGSTDTLKSRIKLKILLRRGSAYYGTSYELDTMVGEVYINGSVNILMDCLCPTMNSHANAVALASYPTIFFLRMIALT
jgi:hypothetical protein